MKTILTYEERMARLPQIEQHGIGYLSMQWSAMQAEIKDLRAALAAADLADALNTMLWLYRRLPKGYGAAPHVDRTVDKLAQAVGLDVEEFLAERRGVPPSAPEHKASCNLNFPATIGTEDDYCDCKPEATGCRLQGGSCQCSAGAAEGCARGSSA